LGWDYEKILVVGGSSLVIPDLMWEIALRLNFGMTRDVEIRPSRKLFQFCIV
jgi:hypothetical protein